MSDASADDDGGSRGSAVPRLAERIPSGPLYDGSAILDRFLSWVQETGKEPYPAQEEALLELMTGKHVILSTPTGSGKSLVATGLHFKAMCEEKRSFYTAPIKALVSEKFFDLCEQFGAENVGMLTGDASINWAAPIICCTAEVLSNMAIDQGRDTDAPYVIMDEFHYYSDKERGSAWQIPLIVLPQSRFLLMSATLGNTSAIEQAIEQRTGREVARVHSDERPVPLDYSYMETPLHETVERLRSRGQAPIYIVHFTQREAADQAQALTSAAITDREEKRAIARALVGFRFDTPYGKDIQRFLGHGIGLHHAGLLPKYRLLVERLAQQGLLKVICGTDTLGVGINVPIRSVLFSKLCKFDGEKVTILSVRDFKQIAGRSGRKGFDESGSVVAQAPEHVIENKKLEAKAAGAGGRKKFVKKKPPNRGFVHWDESTFQRLVDDPPETLAPRFSMNHGLIAGCLQSKSAAREAGGGYRALAALVANSHQDARRKRRLMREAAGLFRSLRAANVVEIVADEESGRPGARVHSGLQDDLSLHHSLSLYLIEAATALDIESPDYAQDLLSLTEAILENPRPILIAQERKAKGELVARLKAEGMPYEERMERLDEVSWPKPNEDFIYATFNLFREKHPWVGSESIRPKGIALDLHDTYSTFDDYVRNMGIARVEGLLLRYLAQVHDSLARTVPADRRNDAVEDMIGFFRSLVARVDSSLIEAWEDLVAPASQAAAEADVPEREYDLAADPRAFRARVRSELQSLVRALAKRDYEEAPLALHPSCHEEWTPTRMKAALGDFYEEYESILYDPRARQAHLCVISEHSPRVWKVHQVLLDDRGDDLWNVEGTIDLSEETNPPDPLLRLTRIGS